VTVCDRGRRGSLMVKKRDIFLNGSLLVSLSEKKLLIPRDVFDATTVHLFIIRQRSRISHCNDVR